MRLCFELLLLFCQLLNAKVLRFQYGVYKRIFERRPIYGDSHDSWLRKGKKKKHQTLSGLLSYGILGTFCCLEREGG